MLPYHHYTNRGLMWNYGKVPQVWLFHCYGYSSTQHVHQGILEPESTPLSMCRAPVLPCSTRERKQAGSSPSPCEHASEHVQSARPASGHENKQACFSGFPQTDSCILQCLFSTMAGSSPDPCKHASGNVQSTWSASGHVQSGCPDSKHQRKWAGVHLGFL